MIDIISVGYKKTRTRIRFTCHWCGCIFDADEADYTKRYSGERHFNIAGKEVWKEKYSYRSTCPICGGSICEEEKDVEFWQYTDYEDGTASSQRIDPYENMMMI